MKSSAGDGSWLSEGRALPVAGLGLAEPRDLERRGTVAQLVALRRNSRDALSPAIKSGNYLNSVLAHIEAKRSGAAEAVMLNPRGCGIPDS